MYESLPSGKYYIQPLLHGIFMGKPTHFELAGAPLEGVIVNVHEGIQVSGILTNAFSNQVLPGQTLELEGITGKVQVSTDPNGQFRWMDLSLQNH